MSPGLWQRFPIKLSNCLLTACWKVKHLSVINIWDSRRLFFTHFQAVMPQNKKVTLTTLQPDIINDCKCLITEFLHTVLQIVRISTAAVFFVGTRLKKFRVDILSSGFAFLHHRPPLFLKPPPAPGWHLDSLVILQSVQRWEEQTDWLTPGAVRANPQLKATS